MNNTNTFLAGLMMGLFIAFFIFAKTGPVFIYGDELTGFYTHYGNKVYHLIQITQEP